MKRLALVPWILSALLVLAGCASRPASVDPRTTLSRAQLEGGRPLILAIIPSRDSFSSLNLIGTNGDVTTWETPDDVTVSFRDGVVVATRGLGQDMMMADMSATLAALLAPPAGLYRRFQGTLDGQSEIEYLAFQCRVTARTLETITIIEEQHTTTRTTETCVSPGVEVTNIYWRGSDGVMWKSRQWIGDYIGYLETERLVR